MVINFRPRWILIKLRIPERSSMTLHIGSSLLILLFIPMIPHLPHFCLRKKLWGIPCPGCGISHSVMAAFRFDLARAGGFQPHTLRFEHHVILLFPRLELLKWFKEDEWRRFHVPSAAP
jgi:hypothetical protein